MRRTLLRVVRLSLRIIVVVVLIIGCTLTCFRVQAAIRERRTAAEIAPADGQLVPVNGGRIFIQTTGPADGIPVVFTHGMGAWSELWRLTLDEVGSAGFRAIALDLPPFGFSDRPTPPRYTCSDQADRIIGVLDALRIPRAIFVGHSFGGGPTLEAALRRPDRVEALVLADPAVNFDETHDAPGMTSHLLAIRPLRNAILSATMTNPLLSRFLLSQFVARQEAVSDARLQVLRRPLAIEGTTDALGDWLVAFASPENGLQTQRQDAYSSFKRPSLIIWGALDQTTPLAQGRRLHQLIPASRLSVLDGVGHMPQIEDPAAFNRVLLDFLQRFKVRGRPVE
jgi:pimeloyl-ACP methyl ester carboxylesterase